MKIKDSYESLTHENKRRGIPTYAIYMVLSIAFLVLFTVSLICKSSTQAIIMSLVAAIYTLAKGVYQTKNLKFDKQIMKNTAKYVFTNPILLAIVSIITVIVCSTAGSRVAEEPINPDPEPTYTVPIVTQTMTTKSTTEPIVKKTDETTTTFTTTATTTTTSDDEYREPVIPKELTHDSIVGFLTEIAEYNIPGTTELKAVTFENRHINIIVDATNIAEGSNFPDYMLVEHYIPFITDDILDYPELRDYFDDITIEFVPFKPITFYKDQIKTNSYGMQYFEVPEGYFE